MFHIFVLGSITIVFYYSLYKIQSSLLVIENTFTFFVLLTTI